MEVLLGILIALSVLVGIVLSRIMTTFIHELGHAISALLLTKENVAMFVGSYGDERKSLKMVFGRLTIYISFIVWDMDMGLCKSSDQVQTWRAFLIILSGPLMSLILGGFFLLMITLDSFTDVEKFVLSILMVSSFWDFAVNMIPRRDPTLLFDGSECYNDGKQALELYRLTTSSPAYLKAIKSYSSGAYADALEILKKNHAHLKEQNRSQQLEMDILIKLGKDDEYLELFKRFSATNKTKPKYTAHWAKIKIKKHDYDEVISHLTKLIYEGKENYSFYFLRGKALVELGEYKDAMRDFHALTLGEIEDPLSLANRAYCQFRLGYEDEAIEDVLEAIDNGKSNMGEIYFLAGVICEGKFEERALGFYKKALDLGYKHHALPFNISRIEKYK